MKSDRELCEAYATKLSNGFYRVELDGFAEACFNDNSIDELREALKQRSADKTDCENWGITPTQWRESIEAALAARLISCNDDNLPA
jgi:hypothetical protein